MPATSVLTFWLVALLLIAVPGADWAFTIAAGLRSRSVAPAVGGLVLGYAGMTAVVAAGVGALVAGSAAILTGLTAMGGAYLILHGVTTAARSAALPAATDRAARTHWGTVARGVGVSGLNPKALLIFLALLPQFTDPRGGWPIALQLCVLGLTFVVTCAVFYLGLGHLAHSILATRPAVARMTGRAAGVGMVAVGAGLLVEHFG
jgi:threonine/homoserine/homoserine lactone efflux protein